MGSPEPLDRVAARALLAEYDGDIRRALCRCVYQQYLADARVDDSDQQYWGRILFQLTRMVKPTTG
ncbi:MAG TPA: hypothetical protein VM487_12040 [Phycisphaerae bacterium]|nr:hypothetical protein [Phycisphaerae bacterium]